MKYLLLVLGTAIIIMAAAYTLVDLRDRVVISVLVPGVVLGLILIGASTMVGRGRTRGE